MIPSGVQSFGVYNFTLKGLVLAEYNTFITYERYKVCLNLKQVYDFDKNQNLAWYMLSIHVQGVSFILSYLKWLKCALKNNN